VAGLPAADLYKPAGVPMRRLETVELAVDELEAMRLVDHEGLSHEEAAHYLGVSRQTVGRVVAPQSHRRTVERQGARDRWRGVQPGSHGALLRRLRLALGRER
jgi:predicted DNA-binding protein (UPF0251 family)